MSTPSLIGALLSKYAALDPTGFPGAALAPIAFAQMPQTNSAGAQLSAEDGYVVLKEDSGQSEPLAFGRTTNEKYDVTWEIFFVSLADCTAVAACIRFNGGTPAQRLGLDGGTLPDLTGATVRDIIHTQTVPTMEGHGKTGKLVHCVRVHHRVCLTRSGS